MTDIEDVYRERCSDDACADSLKQDIKILFGCNYRIE
jgi:hypothetical protein